MPVKTKARKNAACDGTYSMDTIQTKTAEANDETTMKRADGSEEAEALASAESLV